MSASDNSCLSLGAVFGEAFTQSRDLHQVVTQLYETHRKGIYRFLVGQGLDPAVAQEITQDVFVDLFLALRRGTSLRSEQRWLYAVAGRAAVDHWRREGRPVWVWLDSQPAVASTLCIRETTPEVQASNKERLVRMSEALRRLPKEQRLAIHLRMEGLRYREIADVLGVSTSTAAEWLSTAVERLRGELDA